MVNSICQHSRQLTNCASGEKHYLVRVRS
jgi:hypothetical protein